MISMQAVFGRAVAAIGIGMVPLHQVLVAGRDLAPPWR